MSKPEPTRVELETFKKEANEHQMTVIRIMLICSEILMRRARCHDDSKLHESEINAFAASTVKLKTLSYPSPEYDESLAMLGDALRCHYATNSHHPEYHDEDPKRATESPNNLKGNLLDGAAVAKMDLFDVVEMFVDWMAAVDRHDDGDIHTSIVYNEKRFGINPQLSKIFSNTVATLEKERS